MTVVRAATNGEKTLLRTPGDWSKAYLAIYKPNVIYTAVLSVVPTSTDMVGQISFSGGSGTLANVMAEMTLWVGSIAGGRDLGTARIRKAPIAGTIYIGYTSEINWANAGTVYLTIVDHAMLSRKPVAVSAGSILMDGEYTFTDQHTNFDPAPVLTPHAVATLTGATVNVNFEASDSWVFGSTIASYAWSAPGASASSGIATSTATITYNAAGYYRVYCTVTAANGKTATGVRFVMVFDATTTPHVVEVQSPEADYDGGGWEFNVKMFANSDPANVIEGALAILFAEDHYGATTQSIGQVANRENIICWGYIAGESIDWDAEISSVEFSVQGPQYWLKQIDVNPTVLSFAASTPATWGDMTALTVDRALWHILHWRSNASALLSITLTGDARYATKIESAEGTIWSQLENVAWERIFGRIGCDRYGRFFAVIDPQCVPEADRTWASVMTLTKKDWRDRVGIVRTKQRKLAKVYAAGFVVDGSGISSTLYALSMGHIGAQHGGSETFDQLLAVDQAQFNELAGLYLAWKNNELTFDFTLAQNNRMVDLWPNQFLDVALAAGDTPRGIAYTGNLVPRSIALQFDAETGCWDTEISCEAETFAELAVDGDVPAETGIEDFDSTTLPDFNMDDFDLGDLPDLPPFDNEIGPGTEVTTPCATAAANAFYLSFSPRILTGVTAIRVARTYFPCVIRASGGLYATSITVAGRFVGDARTNFVVYGISGGTRVITGVMSGATATFSPISDTPVDGFEIELSAGFGTLAELGNIVSYGSVNVKSNVGVNVPTTIGQMYAIEGTGGPFNVAGAGSTSYNFDIAVNGSAYSGNLGRMIIGATNEFNLVTPSGFITSEAVDANHARTYWIAGGASYNFRAWDYNNPTFYADNTGTFGYLLRYAIGRRIELGSCILRNVCVL